MKPYCRLLCIALLALSASAAHAQMYKWIGADGKVNYTDTPPPAGAKTAEKRSFASEGDAAAGDLPYELSSAIKNSPVTLYTTGECPPCNEGRKLLATRGVPYAEKTVNSAEDIAKLREMGANQLPFLVIGQQVQQGMESGIWNSLLTAAGYPESNRLPKTYRNPAPQPAVAPKTLAKADDKDGKDAKDKKNGERKDERADALPPAVGTNVPPGFRF